MQNQDAGQMLIRQEWEAWMEIANPDLSVEDAVTKLREMGNEILEVDHEGRRVKVMHVKPDHQSHDIEMDVWVCDFCGAHSRFYEVAHAHEQSCEKKG